jgi:hypothetical protein
MQKLAQAMTPEMQDTDSWETSFSTEYSTSPTPSQGPADDNVKKAFDDYIQLINSGYDYFTIVYELKDKYGDDVATRVLEMAVDNDVLASKHAQEDMKTFFAVSDGNETKVVNEETYNQYWSDLFEGGFDIIGKYFTNSALATQPDWTPPLDDPNWQWMTPTEDKMPTGFLL